MITKELVEQWSDESGEKATPGQMVWYIAQRAAAYGAEQRERELLEEGVYPKWHLDSMVAAARLQGAEEIRAKIVTILLKPSNDYMNGEDFYNVVTHIAAASQEVRK